MLVRISVAALKKELYGKVRFRGICSSRFPLRPMQMLL